MFKSIFFNLAKLNVEARVQYFSFLKSKSEELGCFLELFKQVGFCIPNEKHSHTFHIRRSKKEAFHIGK